MAYQSRALRWIYSFCIFTKAKKRKGEKYMFFDKDCIINEFIRGLIKKLMLFSICSRRTNFFFNNYIVTFKAFRFRYITFIPAFLLSQFMKHFWYSQQLLFWFFFHLPNRNKTLSLHQLVCYHSAKSLICFFFFINLCVSNELLQRIHSC